MGRRRSGVSVSTEFSRRSILRLGAAIPLAVGASKAALISGCTYTAEDALLPAGGRKAPLPSPQWLNGARIAGFAASVDETLYSVATRLDEFAEQGVTVVEADGNLSSYLDEDAFKEQLDMLHNIATGSQMRGMRCVAYYPTLETLTPEAEKTSRTMVKEHPDWIQISIDGKPNWFLGGGGRVFWVEPGEESAWTCPTSGYVDYFCDRVNKLATSALDGVWGDVPLLSDIGGNWPCVNPSCRDKFKRETGRDIPSKVDWEDETFRVWVNWRHKIMWEFEQEVYKRSKAVRADFETIMETVTMDYNGGTVQGLDGGYKDDGGVYRVWEVDAVSDGTSMRNGAANDWISMAVMMRHGASSSRPRPSWIFSYGLEAADAEHVMALAIATGNCPYETRIPLMCDIVSPEYRKRMFTWIRDNQWVYEAEQKNSAAILFSSSSRDYLDRNKGVGLYTSQFEPDKLWWSTEENSNVQNLEYLGDYRGAHKVMIHAHVPFDVITASHFNSQSAGRYRLIVVPSAVALSDEEVATLKSFTEAGGTVLLTGMDAGVYRPTGEKRATPLLLDALGIPPTAQGFSTRALGTGQVVHSQARAGQQYMLTDAPAALSELEKTAKATRTALETNAPRAVVFDLRQAKDGRVGLLAANLDGLGASGVGTFTPKKATFQVWVPALGRTPKRVTLSEPGSAPAPIAFKHDAAGDRVDVTITVSALALITIE